MIRWARNISHWQVIRDLEGQGRPGLSGGWESTPGKEAGSGQFDPALIRGCPKVFIYLYFCLFFSWEAGARIACNLEASQGRSGTTVGPRWQERWGWRKQVIIQTCAKGKGQSEAHDGPGPIHHRWKEASSGVQPLHTFSWSVFLLVSLGKYGSELGMVLEEVAAVGYHDR